MPGALVRFVGPEPSAFITQTSSPLLEKAILVPSADHAGSSSVATDPSVSILPPVPSAFIT